MTTITNLAQENEELRQYIVVLKSALDEKAIQLGLGQKKVCDILFIFFSLIQ